MKYIIRIYYTTGDSYTTRATTGDIGHSWENLDVAKQNLQRIKEHYEWTAEVRWGNSVPPSWLNVDGIGKKDGYYKEQYYLNLLRDDGEEFIVPVFWHGVFESLRGAKILEDKDTSGMAFGDTQTTRWD